MPVAPRTTKARHSRQESRQRIVDAATDLVRTMPYAALSVDEVMRRAGLGRTIFYRHFDDLADLLMRAGREAVEQLYAAQEVLGAAAEPAVVRRAMENAVAVYERHGPLLRAISEAAAVDERVHAGQQAMRARFDELLQHVLEQLLPGAADLDELARALNAMNVSYLLDVFGREPRVPAETAVATLARVWDAVLEPAAPR